MTSRPKSQENSYKSKLLTSTELRSRGSNVNTAKPSEQMVAEISMKDFLDFLKISYQVNEAVEGNKTDIGDKLHLDWKRLTNNTLINQLKEKEDLSQPPEGKKTTNQTTKLDRPSNTTIDEKTELNIKKTESCNKVPSKTSCQNSEEKHAESEGLVEGHSASLDNGAPLSVEKKVDKKPASKKGKYSLNRRQSSEDKETDKAGQTKYAEKLLKTKLNEVLQEGIMDSVLPYLLPTQEQLQLNLLQPPVKKLLLLNDIKKNACADKNEKNISVTNNSKDKKETRGRSFSSNESEKSNKNDKKDVEVVIHVCDEIKNLKKDFRCSQKLLMSEMGYFAEVTNGQNLEDMDISVHCDVAIFDWLMKWVQKDQAFEDSWPRLDPTIVIPVLLSSAFLQMNTLQDYCLQYCKYNINDILRESSSLTCINDSILTRLANMFSNTEVENLKDKKDKLQSRLYCKLIVALTEPQPQPQRGHYSTVATMYRCSKCFKLILRNISSSILCVPSCMLMDRNGYIISSHIRDPTWNLTDYVMSLKTDLKVWKKVYWRLWSDCHLLFCHTCSSYFPVHQMQWCRYHSEPAQFFMKDNQRSMSFPVGRYPCCGERAYRFEILKNKLGCQYREHTTDPKSAVEMEIYRIWNDYRDLIKAEPPLIAPSERVRHYIKGKDDGSDKKSPVKDSFWWEGLQMVPGRPKIGLFATVWDKIVLKDDKLKPDTRDSRTSSIKKSSMSNRSMTLDLSSSSDSSDQQSSASDAGDSEDSGPATVRVTTKPKVSSTNSQSIAATRSEGSQFWIPKLSTRCNQDNQREFEERAFRQIELILSRKMSGDTLTTSNSRTSCQTTPPGGVYVKLEQEWREAHCNGHGCPANSLKSKTNNASGSNLSSSNTSGRVRTKSHRL